MTNKDRAEKILDFLIMDYDGDDDEASITDLLADLLHFCHQKNIEFDDILETAVMHFNTELAEES